MDGDLLELSLFMSNTPGFTTEECLVSSQNASLSAGRVNLRVRCSGLESGARKAPQFPDRTFHAGFRLSCPPAPRHPRRMRRCAGTSGRACRRFCPARIAWARPKAAGAIRNERNHPGRGLLKSSLQSERTPATRLIAGKKPKRPASCHWLLSPRNTDGPEPEKPAKMRI